MKRSYPHFLNSMNWVLAGLLTLLGFSCSDSDDDGGGQVEEYGCPHANYEIKGKVVNRQNNPIPNIQIAISDSVPDRQMPSDTIYTDAKGEFLWETGEFPGATFKLIMTDIDKDKNGGHLQPIPLLFPLKTPSMKMAAVGTREKPNKRLQSL